jgi:hypothetical protein
LNPLPALEAMKLRPDVCHELRVALRGMEAAR